MKKCISLALALLLAVSFAACGGGGNGEILPPNTNGDSQQNQTQKPTAVTVEPMVLLDQDGVKIQAKEFAADSPFGPELKILIENNSNKDLTVQCRSSSVNGYMVETMISAEVAAGKKANDAITFVSSDLELCGVETVADMEFSFHIFTTEDWETYLDSDPVQVKTSAASTYSYTYDHPGTLVYESNGIKLVAKGLNRGDSLLGPGLVMYIQNTGDKAITVQTPNASVNGFMFEPIFSQEVVPGKHAVSEVTFMASDLEENGITEILDMELSFHIFDSVKWETVADTEKIKLSFGEQ